MRIPGVTRGECWCSYSVLGLSKYEGSDSGVKRGEASAKKENVQ